MMTSLLILCPVYVNNKIHIVDSLIQQPITKLSTLLFFYTYYSYRPQGTGSKCEGVDKKYQTCNAKQCLNVPKLTIREFSEQICTRAKEVDKELTGIGSQRVNGDGE